jgi:hypothetical protein
VLGVTITRKESSTIKGLLPLSDLVEFITTRKYLMPILPSSPM